MHVYLKSVLLVSFEWDEKKKERERNCAGKKAEILFVPKGVKRGSQKILLVGAKTEDRKSWRIFFHISYLPTGKPS